MTEPISSTPIRSRVRKASINTLLLIQALYHVLGGMVILILLDVLFWFVWLDVMAGMSIGG